MAKSNKVNKSEAIREMVAQHPEAKSKEVVALLAGKGGPGAAVLGVLHPQPTAEAAAAAEAGADERDFSEDGLQ